MAAAPGLTLTAPHRKGQHLDRCPEGSSLLCLRFSRRRERRNRRFGAGPRQPPGYAADDCRTPAGRGSVHAPLACSSPTPSGAGARRPARRRCGCTRTASPAPSWGTRGRSARRSTRRAPTSTSSRPRTSPCWRRRSRCGRVRDGAHAGRRRGRWELRLGDGRRAVWPATAAPPPGLAALVERLRGLSAETRRHPVGAVALRLEPPAGAAAGAPLELGLTLHNPGTEAVGLEPGGALRVRATAAGEGRPGGQAGPRGARRRGAARGRGRGAPGRARGGRAAHGRRDARRSRRRGAGAWTSSRCSPPRCPTRATRCASGACCWPARSS